jgi:predicted nucleic acid-binding protein
MRAFIDSNIPMYAAGGEHPSKQPSVQLLQRIAKGELEAVTDAEVFQEILHRYSAIGRLETGLRLFDAFETVVGEVLPVEFEDVVAARKVLQEIPVIKARDAIHISIMRRHNIALVYSFDKHFDQIEGIERREP